MVYGVKGNLLNHGKDMNAQTVTQHGMLKLIIAPTAEQRWMVMGMANTVNEVNELIKVLTRKPKLLANLNTSISNLFRLAGELVANGVKIPVLCKDCKSCRTFYPIKEIDKEAVQVWYCDLYRCNCKPDDFCSYGERRE